MKTTRHQGDPRTGCDDCTTVVADNGRHVAAGTKLCPRHRAEQDERRAAARAANPQIAALHRMMGLA